MANKSMLTMSPGQKINILFDVLLNEDGKAHTNRQVARHIGVTETAVSMIRARVGENQINPTLKTVQGICDFFGVSLDYFSCETPDECRDFIARAKSGVDHRRENRATEPSVTREITLKAMGMSEHAQRAVLAFMDWFEAGDRVLQKQG